MAYGAVSERDTTAVITTPAIRMGVGGTAKLSIQMENGEEMEYNGFQFDIFLPKGMTIAENDSDFVYNLSKRYDENAMVKIKDLDGGFYRAIVFSLSGAAITGNEGELFSLTLRADTTLEVGLYRGDISNFRLSSREGVTFMGTDATFDIEVMAFAKGDVNHDGTVDISDVMLTVYYSLGRKVTDFYLEEGDTNKDGLIDIVDVMNVVYIAIKINM